MGCGPSSPSLTSSSDVPSDPTQHSRQRMSVVSLQLPMNDDDAMSATSNGSIEPPTPIQQQNIEKLCNTEIRVDWLVKKIGNHFPLIEEHPQWIAERLNRKPQSETESSCVIRVTFAWENESENLPKTVIVKIPLSKGAREDETGRFYYALFKRECNAYEWLQRIPNIAAPNVFHIKKHGNEDGGAALILEDLEEKADQIDERSGLSVELVQDLLCQLAFLHSQSWTNSQWTTLVADLPPSFYAHEAGKFSETVEFFASNSVEPERMKKIEKYFTSSFLENTVTESCDELNISKVLVHGEPFSANIFVSEKRIVGMTDWTGCHSGCFGEDLAKAICWNLSSKDRIAHTSSLLQAYHYQLVLHSADSSITAEKVRAAYEKFVPIAMVSFVQKVMLLHERIEMEPLVERAKSLINQVYSSVRMREEMNGPEENNNGEAFS